MPTEMEIIVKEQLLEHKFVMNNLNIQKCNICLKCHMEKDVMMKQDSYTCKKCKDRNDQNHFIKNNMHPWLRNCLFKDVQILCYQYIYRMGPLH
jgi:hypothetical protein